MKTAVDTSVLVAIAKGEEGALDWAEVLAQASKEGDLIICEVVAAELFALLLNESIFGELLRRLAIRLESSSIQTACQAGSIFRRYRRHGGPRDHLVPDFLIGAHAYTQADRIAAIDRGYLRRYFPRLRILQPTRAQ